MNLDLSDAEAPALIALLKHAIADDRYPLSERMQTWQGMLALCLGGGLKLSRRHGHRNLLRSA